MGSAEADAEAEAETPRLRPDCRREVLGSVKACAGPAGRLPVGVWVCEKE